MWSVACTGPSMCASGRYTRGWWLSSSIRALRAWRSSASAEVHGSFEVFMSTSIHPWLLHTWCGRPVAFVVTVESTGTKPTAVTVGRRAYMSVDSAMFCVVVTALPCVS